MPFYEYECQACGAHHEAMQKMSDAPLRKCPACGRQKLVRQISAPVFRLKGGGWYETDFKSDKESKRNLHGDDKPDPPAAAGSAAKPAKTEAAPAAAPAKAAESKPAKAKAAPASRKPAARRAAPARKASPKKGSGRR
jgi:putative FmdB family regulatory protein